RDWSSDVCSSDLDGRTCRDAQRPEALECGRREDVADSLEVGAELCGVGQVRLRTGAFAACDRDKGGGGREGPPGAAIRWHAVPPGVAAIVSGRAAFPLAT